MKASELIEKLQKIVAENGDISVMICEDECEYFDIKDVEIIQYYDDKVGHRIIGIR